jgi:hypothetical protein
VTTRRPEVRKRQRLADSSSTIDENSLLRGGIKRFLRAKTKACPLPPAGENFRPLPSPQYPTPLDTTGSTITGGITGGGITACAGQHGSAHAVVSCHPGMTNPGVYAGGTNSPGITVPFTAGTTVGRTAETYRGGFPGVQNPGV